MRLAYAVSVIALLSFSAPALADEYVIMKVNNQDVTSSEVKRLWEGLFPVGQAPAFDSVKPDMRDRILRGVMAEKILYGEALKAGIDKSPKLVSDLEDLKKKLIVRSYLDAKSSDLISDAELKKEYDTVISGMKEEKQVHARHILLATEEEAKEAKKKIDSGKSFEEVAKDYSKDATSAKNGGDLGFFTRDKMVKEFADAAFSMKKGEVSGPVKTSFGYHIIKVEEIGKMPVPTFEEVKPQIQAKLQEKKLNDFIGGLVKNADVKVFDVNGKEVPFDRNLPPADAKPADVKPVAAKPVAEAKPVEAKPAEVKKVDKPAEKPAEKPPEKPAPGPKPAAEAKPVKKVEKPVARVRDDEPVLPVKLEKVTDPNERDFGGPH